MAQLVYKHLEGQAAAEQNEESSLAAEEEALLQGGHGDYPQHLSHAVDNLHESSVISICCWPGDCTKLVTGSGMTMCSVKAAVLMTMPCMHVLLQLIHHGNYHDQHKVNQLAPLDACTDSNLHAVCQPEGPCSVTGNGLIQLVDYIRDAFEWRYQGNAGGILNLAMQPCAQ